MSSAEATVLSLHGRSLIAGRYALEGGEFFRAFHPIDGRELDPPYVSAGSEEVEQAVAAAVRAGPVLAASTVKQRGALLRRIADGLDAAAEALIERAHLETALPLPRLTGEV